MNTNNIWLVTADRETGFLEQTTLELWIRKDQDLWARRRGDKPPLNWLILSAHGSAEEAEARIEQLQED